MFASLMVTPYQQGKFRDFCLKRFAVGHLLESLGPSGAETREKSEESLPRPPALGPPRAQRIS